MREFVKDEIETLASYAGILKQADFAYGRYDYYARKGHKRGAARMQAKATRLYERAYEHLAELLEREPQLAEWLDRDFDSTPESAPGTDIDSAPRVITSRSVRNQAPHKSLQSVMDCKISAVTDALYALKYAHSENTSNKEIR
ncbi:hypothetical protein [Spiribacter roseus]|uniref:hypothetical protein n=1 Tax=Spiribacter roseus TaxID=1855875 RepID=UPI001330E8BF|nr:hypothetical protein [Spiribacter roseus]